MSNNKFDEYEEPLYFKAQKEDNNEQEEYFTIPDPETTYFPPKPIQVEKNKEKSVQSTVISMIAFIVIFHFVFNWEIINILILAGVVFVHELGHFFAMKYFNYSNLGIFFVPLLGAFTSGTKKEVSQKQNAIILLAGPVPGIIIGIALTFLSIRTGDRMLASAASIFLYINLFNLLPIIPLDGGRLVNNLFFDSSRVVKMLFVIVSIIGLASYAVFTRSYMLLIVAVFLFVSLKNDKRDYNFTTILKSKLFNTNKSFDELSNREYWLVRDELGFDDKSYRKFMTPGVYEYSENEEVLFRRIQNLFFKEPLKDLSTLGKILFGMFWLLMILLPIAVIVLVKIGL